MRKRLGLLLLIGFLSGCANNPQSQYFRLPVPQVKSSEPDVTGNSRTASATNLRSDESAWGLWPVELPRELRRDEIVTFPAPLRAAISAQHRWSMALNEQLDRQLALELADHITLWRYPWPTGKRPAQQIQLQLLHLGGPLEGPVTLQAEWQLATPNHERHSIHRLHRQREVMGGGYDAYVEALAVLTHELAEALLGTLQNSEKHREVDKARKP